MLTIHCVVPDRSDKKAGIKLGWYKLWRVWLDSGTVVGLVGKRCVRLRAAGRVASARCTVTSRCWTNRLPDLPLFLRVPRDRPARSVVM